MMLFRFTAILASLAAALTLSQRAEAKTQAYGGYCDASGLVVLDGGHFAIVDDENNKIPIYRFDAPQPVEVVALDAYLAMEPKAREGDLEGTARIGERLYAIGSHGASDKGEYREARHRLFYVTIGAKDGAPTLSPPAARPYVDLTRALAADPRFAELNPLEGPRMPAKAPGAFNIEGLAATPEGGLLIGFRSPHAKDGKAYLIELKNPAALIDDHAAPQFGDLMRLDLGKRGVRGLTRIRDRYVIAAGPHGDERYVDGATDYKLFSWNGQPQDAPVLIEAPIDGLTLEALAPAPDGASLLLVSDDGRAQLGSGLID